mgnify:CR=1 FL=1
MISDSSLKLVYSKENESLYEFRPSIFKLHYKFLDRYFFGRKLRYVYEYLQPKHYLVYYYALDDEIIGQCVVFPGGRRVEGTTNKDIVIGGPYYIIPSQRRKGLCKKMIQLTLKHCSYDYHRVYAYISKGNTPSINTAKGLGMQTIKEGNLSKYLHKLVQLFSSSSLKIT